MDDDDKCQVNSAREIGQVDDESFGRIPRAGVVPTAYGLMFCRRPGRSDEAQNDVDKMVVYSFSPSCFNFNDLVGAFITLSSIIFDLNSKAEDRSITLNIKNEDKNLNVAVFVTAVGESNFLVLALPDRLESALEPLCQQIYKYLTCLSGSLMEAFSDNVRMDGLCRRLFSVLDDKMTIKVLFLINDAYSWCPLDAIQRSRLECVVVDLESCLQGELYTNEKSHLNIRPSVVIGTCAFLQESLLFSHVSESVLEFVHRFLMLNVFFAKRPSHNLFYERFHLSEEKSSNLALQVLTKEGITLVAVLSTSDEEPAIENIQLLRSCMKELINLVTEMDLSPKRHHVVDVDQFVSEVKVKQESKYFSWMRPQTSPKQSRKGSLSAPQGDSVPSPMTQSIIGCHPNPLFSLFMLDNFSKALMHFPPFVVSHSLYRDALNSHFLTACLKLRQHLREMAAKDPQRSAEIGFLTKLTDLDASSNGSPTKDKKSFCLAYWIVGRREGGGECYLAYHESVPLNVQEVMYRCQSLLLGV